MVCALVGSATWVIFASSRGWPVSTTHSIVGAIIGVGIAAFGWDSKYQRFLLFLLFLLIKSNQI